MVRAERYLAKARALRSEILESRDAFEAARSLTPDIAESLIDAEMFRLLVPEDAGGLELDPLGAHRIYEELARADASVAWVTWNNGLPAVLSRNLTATVRKEIFGNPRAVLGNSTRPSGTAVGEGDGFRVSGRWSLVSGCQLADWIPVMARIESTGERVPPRMFFLPKGDYEILDTWKSGGLRGSGSHDVVAENVFVPSERSCSPGAEPTLEGPLHRFPFAPVLAPGCASMCLGIAQSALEAVLEIISGKPETDSGPPLEERALVHAAVAEAEGQIEAARLFLHDSVREVWEACLVGHSTLPQRARLWRAVVHAAVSSKQVIGNLFEVGGTSSLYTRGRLERCHRDIWTISQHVILNPLWRVQAGRVRIGLDPSNPMF